MEPEVFINTVFKDQQPERKKLWLDKTLQQEIKKILGHELGVLRVRYWRYEKRTAWILDEIGKELPITVGIVVNASGIEQIKVLIFRETRGWEIRYPFFTDQFTGAKLEAGNNLDKRIDGISGATLSVGAVERLARLALLFHRHSEYPVSE